MNSAELCRLIDQFESLAEERLFCRTEWGAVWAKAKEIQVGFKGIRFPSWEAHQQQWERFCSIREKASQRKEREREELRATSDGHRAEILQIVQRGTPPTGLGGAIFELIDPTTVNELKDYGRFLKEAGERLSELKRDMLHEHKQECFEAIVEAREVLDSYWERVHQARDTRRGDALTRARENLERNRERFEKAANALRSMRNSQEDLQDKIASSWNDEWAEKAQGWLSELEDKIADTEKSVERIEGWIEEDQRRIRDLGG